MDKSTLKIATALLFVVICQLCHAGKISVEKGGGMQHNTQLRSEKPPPPPLPVPVPVPLRSSIQKTSPAERHLQAFSYTANYKAKFQYVRAPFCSGPAPLIRLYCEGPNIQVIKTSDDSIVCSNSSVVDTDGSSFIVCVNTCASDAACATVYLVADASFSDGPFGEIDFQCAGNTIDEVDTLISFENSGNGTCANSSQIISPNIHLLQLGVSCPSESGSSDYVFDDYYFDCRPASNSFLYDVYTCLSGAVCEPGAACDIAFDTLIVNADLPNFMDKCVETSLSVGPAPAPTPTPTQKNYTYSAKFAGAWALLFEPGSVCSRISPTVRVTCLKNGAIKFVNATYDTVSCATVNQSVMECTDSANYFGKFTNVSYECSGTDFPETMIEFPEEAAFCEGNGNSTVQHAVQLGVFCDSGKVEYLFSGDLYFDCVGVSPQFSVLDELGSTDGYRYTCSQSATFLSGSTADQTLPSVAISTDSNWAGSRDVECVKFASTTVISSPSPVTEAPVTVSPNQAPITPVLTFSPTMRSVVISTPPTTTALTLEPARNPTQSQQGTQSAPNPTATFIPASNPKTPPDVTTSEANGGGGSAAVGAAVGGAVGAFVVFGILAFFVLKRRAGSNSGPVQEFKERGVGPGISAANNDHSPADTGHSVETGYPHQSDDATQPSTQGEAVAMGSKSAAALQAAALPSSPGSSPRERQRPTGPVQYKDQVRSVLHVPLVNVMPVSATDSLYRNQTPVQATAVAAQVMDNTSTLSGATGASRGSDPDGRRAIDP